MLPRSSSEDLEPTEENTESEYDDYSEVDILEVNIRMLKNLKSKTKSINVNVDIYGYPITTCSSIEYSNSITNNIRLHHNYPESIWIKILKYAPFKSLIRLRKISKIFGTMIGNETLWQWKLRQDYGLVNPFKYKSYFYTYRLFIWADHLASFYSIIRDLPLRNDGTTFMLSFLHSRDLPFPRAKYSDKDRAKRCFGLTDDEIRDKYDKIIKRYLTSFNCRPSTQLEEFNFKIFEHIHSAGYRFLLTPLRERVRRVAYLDYPEVIDLVSTYRTQINRKDSFRWEFLHDILVEKLTKENVTLSQFVVDNCAKFNTRVQEEFSYYYIISMFIRRMFGKIALIRYPFYHTLFSTYVREENILIYSYYRLCYELRADVRIKKEIIDIAGEKFNNFNLFERCISYITTEFQNYHRDNKNYLVKSFNGLYEIGSTYSNRFHGVLDLIKKETTIYDDSITDIILNHPYCRIYLLSGESKYINMLKNFLSSICSLHNWVIAHRNSNFCSNPYYSRYSMIPGMRSFIIDVSNWHLKFGEEHLPLNAFLAKKHKRGDINKLKFFIIYHYCKNTFSMCKITKPKGTGGYKITPGKHNCACPHNVYCIHRYYLTNWSYLDD